jgi:hypothetical protein
VFELKFFSDRLGQSIDKNAGRKTATAMSASRLATVITLLHQPYSA